MKVVPNITQQDLSKALQIGLEAIRKLRKEGLPCTKVKGRLELSPSSVYEWLIETNRHKHAQRLAAVYPEIAAHVEIPDDLDSEIADLDKYIERVRFNECVLHEFVKAAKDNPAGLQMAVVNYSEACKQRLAVEKEISRIKMDQSKSISREETNRQFAECAQIVQNALMSLPGALAGRLEGRKASEINDILFKELHAVLEEMSR